MNQKTIEKQSLIVSSIVNFFSAIAGMAMYIATDLNAILLDGVFSIIGFISSLAAIYIAQNSHRKTDSFPNGMHFLEPFYGILKSIATLMLLFMALLQGSATAFAYFVHGEGEPMLTGPILPYALVTGLACFLLYRYNIKQNQKIHNMSTIIRAESKANLIDGTISLGIAATVLGLSLIDINGSLGFLHYTGDFFITLILVIISVKEPVQSLKHSFKEFARSTVQNDRIKEAVLQVLKKNLHPHKEDLDIYIFKQGTHIMVRIYVVSVEEADFVEYLALKKASILRQLRKKFDYVSLEFSF